MPCPVRRADALDAQEELTPLGRHLAALPLDPRLGKMMLCVLLQFVHFCACDSVSAMLCSLSLPVGSMP